MTTVHGPIVCRRRLRIALRNNRENAGLTQEHVAREMDWSLSKLIRIENGSVRVSITDVRQLLQLYGVTDPVQVSDLVDMARIARRQTWLNEFKDDVPSPYASYIGLEAEASTLWYYHALGVPGLLQTRAYATAVVSGIIKVDPQEVDTMVAVRMARQREVLGRPTPPTMTVLLDESVLYRNFGGPEVMREQLWSLAASAERPNITVQVLPFSAADNTMIGPFIILDFPDPADASVAYVESALVQDVTDRPEDITRYRRTYDRLQQLSLDQGQSLDLIKKIAGEL